MYIETKALRVDGGLNPGRAFSTISFRNDFYDSHPHYFRPEGIITFCGAQGEGKTLSAVQFAINLLLQYPKAILCTNVELKRFPFNAEFCTINGERKVVFTDTGEIFEPGKPPSHRMVIEYIGLDSLLYLNNSEYGVIYLIDEIHLELNSMESKNIDMNYFVELSQQRKQRKIIVGTSQKYMRMHIALRQQIHYVVICRNFFNVLQFNKLVDNQSSYEQDGKLVCKGTKRFLWFHSPEQYQEYDTYQKMKRYKNEWKEVSRSELLQKEYV